MNRLQRLYAISEEVRRQAPRPVSARWLAEQFDVSQRTVERDLAALANAGVPLYADLGRRGGHSVLPTSSSMVLTLTADEATALILAATITTGMPYGDAGSSAIARLTAALDPATQVHLDSLRQKIRVPERPTTPLATPRVRATIEEAVRTNTVINIAYSDRHDVTTARQVEPVGFYGHTDGWYLIGWCRLRDAGRIFRLDRIRRATLTKETAPDRDAAVVLGWVPESTTTPTTRTRSN